MRCYGHMVCLFVYSIFSNPARQQSIKKTYFQAQEAWWSVNLVCGTAGLIGGLLVRFLPETRNLPMPETLQDLERRRRNFKEARDTKAVDELNELRSEGGAPTERD